VLALVSTDLTSATKSTSLAGLGSFVDVLLDRFAQAAALLQFHGQDFHVLGDDTVAHLDLRQVLGFLADDDVEDVAILALERDGARLLVDRDDFGFGPDGVPHDHGGGFGGRGGGLRVRRMG
jgi:hypothetical protein